MARELRDLLERAAGEPRDILDFDPVWRRSRRVTWRRRAGALAALALIGMAVLVTYRSLPLRPTRPARPSPPPPQRVEPLELGALEPGRYAVDAFAVSFELEVPTRGWRAEALSRSWLMLVLDGTTNVHVQRWRGVFDPATDPLRARDVGPLPEDLAGWLERHPRLRLVGRAPVSLGGLTGTRLDVEVSDPLGTPPAECVDPCVLLGLVRGAREPVDIEAGTRARFLVLEAPGSPVIVYFRAPVASFDDVAARIERLLLTIVFGPA